MYNTQNLATPNSDSLAVSHDLAVCLNNLTFHEGKPHLEAIALFRQAYKGYKALPGTDNSKKIATVAANLGRALLNNTNRQDADNMEALEMWQTVYDYWVVAPENRMDLAAEAARNMSICLLELDRYVEAVPYLQMVVKWSRGEKGPNHDSTKADEMLLKSALSESKGQR